MIHLAWQKDITSVHSTLTLQENHVQAQQLPLRQTCHLYKILHD